MFSDGVQILATWGQTSPKPTDAVEGLFREMYILQLKIHQPCVPGIIYTLGLVRLKTPSDASLETPNWLKKNMPAACHRSGVCRKSSAMIGVPHPILSKIQAKKPSTLQVPKGDLLLEFAPQ